MRLFSSKISPSQEMLLRDISSAVLIDVSEQRYTHVFRHDPRRESLLHGAYPDSLYSSAVKEEVNPFLVILIGFLSMCVMVKLTANL